MINGLSLPKSLMIYDTKPWELSFIDTGDIWSFGAWQEGFSSLELITSVLGLPTPKSDIRGEEVSEVFWETGDHMRIAEYCSRDVKALADVLLKISKLPEIDGFEHK